MGSRLDIGQNLNVNLNVGGRKLEVGGKELKPYYEFESVE
jgi:hypothetical protein